MIKEMTSKLALAGRHVGLRVLLVPRFRCQALLLCVCVCARARLRSMLVTPVTKFICVFVCVFCLQVVFWIIF